MLCLLFLPRSRPFLLEQQVVLHELLQTLFEPVSLFFLSGTSYRLVSSSGGSSRSVLLFFPDSRMWQSNFFLLFCKYFFSFFFELLSLDPVFSFCLYSLPTALLQILYIKYREFVEIGSVISFCPVVCRSIEILKPNCHIIC